MNAAARQLASPATSWAIAATGVVLCGGLMATRGDVVPGRGLGGVGVMLMLAAVGLGAWLAGAMTLLTPGARHSYNFHLVTCVAGLGLGWAFASDLGRDQSWVAGAMAVGASASLAVLAGSMVPDERRAAHIGGFVASMTILVLRPLEPNGANIAFLPLASLSAWLMARDLQRPLAEGPVYEAPATRVGTMFVNMNMCLGLALVPVVWMLFLDTASLFLDVLAEDAVVRDGWQRWFAFGDLGLRIGIAVGTGVAAGLLAWWRALPSCDPLRGMAMATLAGAGVLCGGQSATAAGFAFGAASVAMIAVGCGAGLAGGFEGRRWHRPWLAAGLALLLSLNTLEPEPGLKPLGAGPAALAVLAEAVPLALTLAAFYWFVIVRVRDMFPRPIPRSQMPMPGGPPPAPARATPPRRHPSPQ